MSTLRRLVVLLAALALCPPGAALAQATTPEQDLNVSTQPPVPLRDGTTPAPTTTTPRTTTTPAVTGPTAPPPSTTDQASSRATAELPNTGSDPRVLFLVGLALMLLGAGLRLRTADAELY